MTVWCMKPGCSKDWPRDPVFEVACPACGARRGAKCRRPSGHTTWGQGEVHRERDIAADRAGAYGPCPSKRCGLENVAAREASGADLPLFAGLTP